VSTRNTPLADYEHPSIQRLIAERDWRSLPVYDRIGAAYQFVKDELPFGYNSDDDLPASRVLTDGYGQCNTKATLLLALLRGLGVPAKIHAFTIDKALQRGAIPNWLYPLVSPRLQHSWVELEFEGRTIALEGFIIDDTYLRAVQAMHPDEEQFCGFGIATPSLHEPQLNWRGRSTFIQKSGIVDDLGVFTDPDDLYAERGTNLSGWRRAVYRRVVRHIMNWNVSRIRARAR